MDPVHNPTLVCAQASTESDMVWWQYMILEETRLKES
jgi:hypothetical protein